MLNFKSQHYIALLAAFVSLILFIINNKIAKKENITVPQLKNLRAVTNDKEVVSASKNLIEWSNANFVAPI